MNVEPLESNGRKRCVFPPWDLLRGRDVFVNRSQLISELDASVLQHWAPNCGTFSRARERPIPGVANPPPPLRSDQFPEGIPEVLHSLPASKKRKLDLDTQMADLAASECLKTHRSGRYFTLENPKNSIARKLDTWKRLEGAVGVIWPQNIILVCLRVHVGERLKFLFITIPLFRQLGELATGVASVIEPLFLI